MIKFKNSIRCVKKALIKHKKLSVVIAFFLLLGTFLVPNIFAELQAVKSVEFFSKEFNYALKEPGAWRVEKSAIWTDTAKAKITFEIDTIRKTINEFSDVIFVLDVSESMKGDKLNKVKEDASSLIEMLLTNDKNRASIVTFETTSTIVDNLTNDKTTLINDINDLEAIGSTNYYQALVNVGEVLKNYQYEDNRDCIVLFLTDGYPNEYTPNEVFQYSYLKNQYPFLIINGIQYEMGEDILEPIMKVTDKQYTADINSLNNILFDAALSPVGYDEFIITDYINDEYFNISNISSIKTSIGKVDLEYDSGTPKVVWDIGKGNLKSGEKATMTIDVELKNEYINKGGFYPTNKNVVINSFFEGDNLEEIESTKTPVLADNYVVEYDVNAPDGCEIDATLENEKHSVFDNVFKSGKELTCDNYQFKGWKIVTKGVTKVNDDYFIMPESDVLLRAEWSKLAITKSMNGKMTNIQTLYNVMAESSVSDNMKSEFVNSDTGIDFTKISSDTNGKGVYQLSSTKDDEYPVYYYRGNIDNNNVKFAGFCWKAVRTTSTGGVKLIYNGIPNSEGGCTNTTGSATVAGTSAFNRGGKSPALGGYMYGEVYNGFNKALIWYELFGKELETISMLDQINMGQHDSYYYADTVVWNGSNYVLSNSDGSEVVQTEWQEKYSGLKGRYRCLDGAQTTCSQVYYLSSADSENAYVLSLTGGQLLDDVNVEWNLGKTITYDNGMYTMSDVVTINKGDWPEKYSEQFNYTCLDGSVSCKDIYVVQSKSATSMDVVKLSDGETVGSLESQLINMKWIYGNDISWDGTNYTLKNTIESVIYDWNNERSKIGNGYHYTCFSTGASCKEINYVYYTGNTSPYYITLKNGMTIEEAWEKMQANENDSLVKKAIDGWYEKNLIDYTNYLEDTVWCNDRSISNSNGWTKDGNAMNDLLYGSRARNIPEVGCTNLNDSFTVSTENGNGALKYPVALLTSDEVKLAGGLNTNNDKYYLYTNNHFLLLTPSSFHNDGGYNYFVYSNGRLYNSGTVNSTRGVRPSVSLKNGIKVAEGNGLADSPYVLFTE